MNNACYSAEDFYSVKKTDAHVHLNTSRPGVVEQGKKDNFILISINTLIPGFIDIEAQQACIVHQRRHFPGEVFYLTTFQNEGIHEPGWIDRQLAYLKQSFKNGASGVKIWKDIGMVIKDPNGNFIMPDDPVFDPIFNYLEENKIPVLAHIAEPKNCWLPLEEMTVNNDREYFKGHPEYHMYLHPECPSYEELIASVERLLDRHRNLRYVGAHFASLEWSFDELSRRLDRFPNLAVDIAERIGQIQYQSIENWQKVHYFFIRYQDRILYGTDLVLNDDENEEDAKKRVHELWTRDWKYFNTGEMLSSPFVNEQFRGLELPKAVIDKFYFRNALNWYALANVQPSAEPL